MHNAQHKEFVNKYIDAALIEHIAGVGHRMFQSERNAFMMNRLLSQIFAPAPVQVPCGTVLDDVDVPDDAEACA